MEKKRAKGAVVNGYLKFIKKKWGAEGLREAMTFAGIKEQPRDGEWFSMERTDRVLQWIAENKGMELVKEAGRQTGKDLGIFKHLIASIMGIERFLRRAEETYNTIFDFGSLRIEMDRKKAVVYMKGVKITDYSCVAWEGALRGIMEVTRTAGTVKPVEAGGPEDCKFILEWK